MTEYIKVKRPDGTVVTVSQKLYERSYRAQGYKPVKTSGTAESKKTDSKKTDTKKGGT